MSKPFNTSFQDKLSTYRTNNGGQKFNKGFKNPPGTDLPPVNNIGEDGVDHINIWERASTPMGVALSLMADLGFIHPVYGKFRSVEGFWHYIRSVARDDRLRMMVGYKAKKVGDSLVVQRVDDFKALIMEVNWLKVKQCSRLMEDFGKSTLPLEVYYIFEGNRTQTNDHQQGVRIRPASAFWLIKGFEEIRNAIKESREPDFTFLLDPATKRRLQEEAKVLKEAPAPEVETRERAVKPTRSKPAIFNNLYSSDLSKDSVVSNVTQPDCRVSVDIVKNNPEIEDSIKAVDSVETSVAIADIDTEHPVSKPGNNFWGGVTSSVEITTEFVNETSLVISDSVLTAEVPDTVTVAEDEIKVEETPSIDFFENIESSTPADNGGTEDSGTVSETTTD